MPTTIKAVELNTSRQNATAEDHPALIPDIGIAGQLVEPHVRIGVLVFAQTAQFGLSEGKQQESQHRHVILVVIRAPAHFGHLNSLLVHANPGTSSCQILSARLDRPSTSSVTSGWCRRSAGTVGCREAVSSEETNEQVSGTSTNDSATSAHDSKLDVAVQSTDLRNG